MDAALVLILKNCVLQAAGSPSPPPQEPTCTDRPASSEDEDGMLALQPSAAAAESGKPEAQVSPAQIQEELSTAQLAKVPSSAFAACGTAVLGRVALTVPAVLLCLMLSQKRTTKSRTTAGVLYYG